MSAQSLIGGNTDEIVVPSEGEETEGGTIPVLDDTDMAERELLE